MRQYIYHNSYLTKFEHPFALSHITFMNIIIITKI